VHIKNPTAPAYVASFATLPCETLNVTMLQDGENARHNHVLALTLPNIHRFKKIFTCRFSKKSFLIWLLTTPPHVP